MITRSIQIALATLAGAVLIGPASSAEEAAGPTAQKVAAGLHSGHAFGPRIRGDGEWVAYGVRESVKGTFKTGYYAREITGGLFHSVWPNQHPSFEEGEGTASFTDLVDFEWIGEGKNNAMVCLHKDKAEEVLLEKMNVRFGGPGKQEQPAVSHDQKLVVTVGVSEGITDLFVADVADGAPVTQLTFTEESEQRPHFHPKELRILHEMRNPLGSDVWEFNLDTFEHKPVYRAGTSDEILPSWSPKGDKIAFLSNMKDTGKDQYDLYTWTPGEAGLPTLVASNVRRSKHSRGYAWDPLGRFLVTVLNDEAAAFPLVLTPADGSSPPARLEVVSSTDNEDPVMVAMSGSLRLLWVGIPGDAGPDHQWRVVHFVDYDVSEMAALTGQ